MVKLGYVAKTQDVVCLMNNYESGVFVFLLVTKTDE